MRNTTLKRTKRGYVRNLGRTAEDRPQEKFYLGHDKDEALARLKGIIALWKQIEARNGSRPTPPLWDADTLRAAKALASGETPTLKKGDYEPPEKYFSRVNEASREAGVPVLPSDQFLYEVGRKDLIGDIEASHAQMANALGTSTATGQSLHEALRAYQDNLIKREYIDSTDGQLTDNGKTKLDQIKTIITYVPDVDLGTLDYQGCDDIFGIYRRRPISKRYKKPMARKSCSNYIGELGRFFLWLHRSKDFRWRKPEDFELISRTPKENDDDVERESADIPVWTIDELKIINKYALPIERIFFLLGLNCSYGADQAGRLRVSHVRISDIGSSYIRRVRRKKKTRSIHILWEQTLNGVRWALKRRESQNHETDFLLLNDAGHPYWTKTKGGNRSQAIPNLWNRLLDRIQKDHPRFRRLPFNSLRDTSANMVRRIGGEEIASLHLAHKHQSVDENLGRYTNPLRKRHFRVLRKLEKKLQQVFDAAGVDPWAKPKKNYIGLTKIARITGLWSQGVKVAEIARKLGVSVATVYRHIPKDAEMQASAKASEAS